MKEKNIVLSVLDIMKTFHKKVIVSMNCNYKKEKTDHGLLETVN